ncbi:MAG: NAD(P)-dependent oxidoreductase [Bacillota bacterium]|nr:NAD(P)-dependent oxidoreductase [Bacillota bacterium]
MKLVIAEPLGIDKQDLLGYVFSAMAADIEIVYYDSPPAGAPELAARCAEAEIVVIANTPLGAEVLRQCPRLRLISVAFTGFDHIDLELCEEMGVTVMNAAGYATAATAELTLGLALSLLRELPLCDQLSRGGQTRPAPGRELRGKLFGVIGSGSIGLRVAELARAFGCEVCAWSRNPKPVGYINYLSLPELLAAADIVSVHLPLNSNTRGLLDFSMLTLMRPEAVLINTARGAIVDNQALAMLLKSGRLAGAAIDVLDNEPPWPPDHPLFDAPHTLITPHIGFATREAMHTRAKLVFDNIGRWLAAQ